MNVEQYQHVLGIFHRLVKVVSVERVMYSVLKEDQHSNCKMKCANCEVYSHMIIIMHMYSTIHTTACKHHQSGAAQRLTRVT